MNKNALFVIITFGLGFTSCTLDTLPCSDGNHMKDGECIQDDDQHCGSESKDCNSFAGSSEIKCEAGMCIAKSCEIGYHIRKLDPNSIVERVDRPCMLDTDVACGPDAVNCSESVEHWVSGICSGGECIVSHCEDDYHPTEDKHSCEADSVLNCGPNHMNCSSRQGVDVAECKDGFCNVISCRSEFHRMTDNGGFSFCDIDTAIECGEEKIDCRKLDGWQSGICNEGKCTPLTCTDEYHINTDNFSCEKNDIHHCGPGRYDCLSSTGWKDAECIDGRCTLISCQDSYHSIDIVDTRLNGQTCTSDAQTDCGDQHVNCTSIPGWGSGSCTSGKCIPSMCSVGFHLDNETNQCIADDAQNCGDVGHDCTQINGWTTAECILGKCKATECQSGYHITTSNEEFLAGMTCEVDSASKCGINQIDCSKALAGWLEGNCESGTCIPTICQNGLHLSENGTECTIDSVAECGSFDNNCSNIQGWENGNCTESICVPTACQKDYHINGTACEIDSVNACGSVANDCTKKSGWKGGTCENGECKPNNCGSGYYLYNNNCEKSDVNNCGGKNVACSKKINAWKNGTCINNTCRVSSCIDKYHINGNKCDPDSWNACGSTTTDCATSISNSSSGSCDNKQCTLRSCKSNYHVYNNTCEADSQNNCGKHGNVCTVSWYTFLSGVPSFCVDGKCT